MVMTTISYRELQKSLGEQISIAEIEQILFDMGMELDGHDGDELSVEITPERLDLLSAQGLARAIKSFTGIAGQIPQYLAHQNGGYIVNVDPVVSQVRPYTVCAVVKNLSFDDERLKQIINLQEKLHQTLARGRKRGAIGIYPMETISWPIKYTAAAPESFSFIPLGETKALNGKEILTYHETGKEYAYLLEGQNVYPYFIDGANEILSMPPIINSEKTGRVTENTTDIFIECSGFELGLLNQLLMHLTTMFADMGGEVYSVSVNYEQGQIITPNFSPREQKIDITHIKDLVGIELNEEEVIRHLNQMMHEVIEKEGLTWKIRSPPFRYDLWHEVDIIDDIARAYGYNNIELRTPNVASIGSELPISKLREEISEVLVGLGFLETYTFALTSKKEQLTNMLIEENQVGVIDIANGMESQGMLRISLLPQQLQSLAHNRNRPLPQKIFEGAFVVLPDQSKDVKARNEMHLSAMITDKTVTFTQIRQALDAILKTKGIEVNIVPTNHPSFIQGRAGAVIYKNEAIGVVGEIHPQVLENFGLQAPVGAFEINLEKIL